LAEDADRILRMQAVLRLANPDGEAQESRPYHLDEQSKYNLPMQSLEGVEVGE
jgi:hypothetical protein